MLYKVKPLIFEHKGEHKQGDCIINKWEIHGVHWPYTMVVSLNNLATTPIVT